MEPPVRTYSPEWHELRKTRLGASDVGALLGVSPWDTPADVWAVKRGAGRPQPDGSINTPIWWGHQEEPLIITAAMHELYGDVAPAHLDGYCWSMDGLMVSPDAVVTNRQPEQVWGTLPALIEAKVVGIRSGYLWRYGPPAHVLAQVHTQMAVMQTQEAYVAARIGGAPVKTWDIEYREEFCKNVLEVIEMFWSYEDMPPHWEMLVEKTVTSMQ